MNTQEEFEKWFNTNFTWCVNSETPKIDNFIKIHFYLSWQACAELMQKEVDRLKEELEDEQIRLAACGVVALSNTRESAEKQRQMLDKYKSASLDDVIKAVDREMKYREELKALRGFANELCEVVFDGGSLDGSDIQDMMLEHGLLIAEIMNEPCGKGSSSCRCQEYCSAEDFRNGVECYRKMPVLKENTNVVDIQR